MATPVDAAANRHRHIADRLVAIGRVEVGELAMSLKVAQETIRRDLRLLERQGHLQRVHGGAVRRVEQPLSPFDGTTPEHPVEHLRLAELVVDRLPLTGTVFIDASPLTWAVADVLSRRPPAGRDAATGIRVVTTSLDVAVVLSRVQSLHVYNIGGSVDPESRDQQGPWALEELDRFRVDLAVLSPHSVSVAEGLFAASPMAAATLAAQASTARRLWLLLPAERLGRPGIVRAVGIDAVEHIDVVGDADPRQVMPFRAGGIFVTCTP